MSFPKWVFNKDGDKKLVNTPDELKALEGTWADSQAEAAKGKHAGKSDDEDAKDAAKEKEAADKAADEAKNKPATQPATHGTTSAPPPKK